MDFIAGQEWTVKQDKNKSGGWFDSKKNQIIIGTKYPQESTETFLHEVIEAVLNNRGHRYPGRVNGDPYLFNLNHAEFSNVVCDIVFALKDVFK